MDIKISGAGQIPAGEFEHIKISGSGSCDGAVKCISLHASGAVHCHDSVYCTESFHTSGAGHVRGSVTAQVIEGSGALSINGNCTARQKLIAKGAFTVHGEIEAEDADIRGVIDCDGLLNAERLYMDLERRSNIQAIGGSSIEIVARRTERVSFSWFRRKHITVDSTVPTVLVVRESIEGDTVTIEGVRCNTVVGRNVVVGEGCKIDSVRYSESIEIAEDAIVKHCEKV